MRREVQSARLWIKKEARFQMIKNGLVYGLKVALVAVIYVGSTMLVGAVLGAAGVRLPTTGDASGSLLQVVVMGLGAGLTLGPLAARLRVSRLWHLAIWGSVLSFNFASVLLEGAIFTSSLGQALPGLELMMLISSLVTAGGLTWLFAPAAPAAPVQLPQRTALAWVVRFVASAASYVVFYWVFGMLNYNLFTHTYYETYQATLVVPPAQTILLVESLRAFMMVLSVLPLALAWQTSRPRLALLCGLVLFLIGGVIPLAGNPALPLFLRIASGWEIFLQNLSTGVVVALLLGNTAPAHSPATMKTAQPAAR